MCAVVYVREQGAVVRKRGGRMVVTGRSDPSTILLEIPMRHLNGVAVFGGVQVTTQAMTAFLDAGVRVSLHTKSGRLKGHLAPAESKAGSALRILQYEAHLSARQSAVLAISFVAAKVERQVALLKAHLSNYPESQTVRWASDSLAGVLEKLRLRGSEPTTPVDLDVVRGWEGAAAAYFEAFGEMNRSGLPFHGRSRRPPKDPVNAMLSFGYSLVLAEVRGYIEAHGLDPHIGFLHRDRYGRPSLALDLLEPYRPSIDRMVLRCINNRIFQEADFADGFSLATNRELNHPRQTDSPAPDPTTKSGVRLMPAALRRFLDEYEKLVHEEGWRDAREGDASARSFDGDVGWLCRFLRRNDDAPAESSPADDAREV